MADLNALIAQGYQFQAPPDPFAQYAKMQQLDQGEQTNQLNRMKMQEYQRGMEETNAMRRLDPTSATYLQDIARINPEKGFAFSKLQREADTAKLTQEEAKGKVAKQKREFVQQAQRDTSRNPSDANVTAFKEDLMASDLFTDAEKAQMGAGADRILAMPISERQAFMAMQGANAADLKPQVVAPGSGLVPVGATAPVYTQPFAPKEPAKTIGTVNPGDFTSASVAKFNVSGNYADLVAKPVDRAPRPEAAPRTQQISLDDGSLGIVNMDTGVITRSTIDGAPASKNTLKPLPVHAQKSITGGAAALSKLDETIKSVEAADATGFKGFLPDVLLNRADPKGTTARANITDIGSLELHDRSGATITASETPRLLPFIPSIKDDKPTTLKKLKRMRDIQAEELEALQGTYTRDQGYREFKVPEKAVPGVDGAPPAGVDAALWNVMTPGERKLWKK